jgi:hypothetical protein
LGFENIVNGFLIAAKNESVADFFSGFGSAGAALLAVADVAAEADGAAACGAAVVEVVCGAVPLSHGVAPADGDGSSSLRWASLAGGGAAA